MRICRKHRDMAPANNFSNKEMYGMGAVIHFLVTWL